MEKKFDVKEMVTDRIIEELEKGVIPWRKPWISNPAYSGATGKPYSLLNQLMMPSGEYWTFKQVQERGGKIKKGAKTQTVVFWKWLEVEERDENGKQTEHKIPFLRYYRVFNVNDIEGVKPRHPELLTRANENNVEPCAYAESIIDGYKLSSDVKIENLEQSQAYYQPLTDRIVVPLMNQFSEVAEYYSTVFHEITHSTGHPNRLNRFDKFSTAAFGSGEYSKEELIAEIGASALVNISGLETVSSFENNAAYIQNWLRALKNDKNMIISASSKAEKAVEMILGTSN